MTVTHRCSDGTTHELQQGRYLLDAQEYRVEAPCGHVVYHDGEVSHD